SRIETATTASLPVGARIKTRWAFGSGGPLGIGPPHDHILLAPINRSTRENAVKVDQRRAHFGAAGADRIFANRIFVPAAPFFDDGDGLLDSSGRLEIAVQYNRVREISQINGRFHMTNQSMLSQDHNGQHALLTEVSQQLMELGHQKTLIGHGVLITVEAIEHDDTSIVPFHGAANSMGKFARRHFRRINLLYDKALTA